MKKTVLAVILVVTAGVSALFAQSLALKDAIKRTADEIAAALPGKRIAVMEFDSEAPELSAYIMEELTGALVRNGKVKAVDRQNLVFVQKELKFQESGAVDEKTALSIGKMSGAEALIIGSLTKTGKTYRWRVMAVGVESAENEAAVTLDVPADKSYTALVSALKKGKESADTSYREQEMKGVPKTAADFVNRGLIFWERGDMDTAFLSFDSAVKLDAKYAPGWFWRGQVYYKRKDHDRAIADFTQMIKLDPDLAAAYNNRGLEYSNKGNYDKAIADFNQALMIDPGLPAAYHNRAEAYFAKGDDDKAITDYNQAILFGENLALIYTSRAMAYFHKGDDAKAIADLTHAIKIDPNYDNYSMRAYVYAEKGDYNKAIADYTQTIKLDPSDAVVYVLRGNTYSKKGDYDRAIADFTQAIKIDPNHGVAYHRRGISYALGKDDYDRAIADFTQAIKIDPNYATAYYSRGVLYQNKGDMQKANADKAMAKKLGYKE